jgi:MFS family permease
MIHALLPLYLVTVMGASALTVGVIEGVAEATAQIVKIFSGALSDRLGKRKMLTAIGYGLAAFTKPVFPLAPSVGWLFAARFVDRIGKGIRGAPRDALIADITPARLRGASFGLRQSLDTIGAFLGPLVAIVLMSLTADNFKLVFWIAVVPAFLSFGLIAFGVREPVRPVELAPVRAPLSRAQIARLSTTFWIVVALASIFTLARFSEAFLLLRAQSVGLTLARVPAVLVLMNIVYALSAWPAGALSGRIGRFGLLAGGFALLIAADLALAFAGNVAVIAWRGALGAAYGADTRNFGVTRRRYRAGRPSRHGLRSVQPDHGGCDSRRKRCCRRVVGHRGCADDVRDRRDFYGACAHDTAGCSQAAASCSDCSLTLGLTDLAQNFRRVLAKSRGGALGRHRLTADHDRRAHAGNLSAVGGRARELEPHAAMDHLRIVKHLVEIVDWSGRDADCFKLRQEVGAGHPGRQFDQARD